MSRLSEQFSKRPLLSETQPPTNQNRSPRYESLVLKKKNGEVWSFEYALYTRSKLVDDRTTLLLYFSDITVAIKGIRLLPVFNDIRKKCCGELQEADSEFEEELSDAPVIRSIEEVHIT